MTKYKWGSILAQHGNDDELDKVEQALSKREVKPKAYIKCNYDNTEFNRSLSEQEIMELYGNGGE